MKYKTAHRGKKYNVYHIPDVHTLEGSRRMIDEARELLPRVRAIFLEAGEMEAKLIPQIEIFANAISRGEPRALELFAKTKLSDADRGVVLFEFISGTKKRIYYERPSAVSVDLNERFDRLNKRRKILFTCRRYDEALAIFWEMGTLWKQLMGQTDSDIGKQLDRVIIKVRENVLLLLGADHTPSPRKGNIIRKTPHSECPVSFRAVIERAETVSGEAREEILLREMIKEPVYSYWVITRGQDPLLTAERLNPILQVLTLKELKNFYDFMTDTVQASEIPSRGVMWLKNHNLV